MTPPRADGDPDRGERPGREPRRSKLPLFLAALVAADVGVDLYDAGTVSWPWLAVGAVAWAAAAGPVASSAFGRRVGARFRAVGVLGRVAVIVGFAGAMWCWEVAFDLPAVPVGSFVFGGTVGLTLQILLQTRGPN